jgi:group I intron endonuclease
MIIYLITNKIDGKQYVGQTVQTLKRRWAFHICKRSGCIYLKRAMDLHSKENFTIEEICKTNTLEELDQKEKEFIIKFNTLAPNGYNLTTGGERPNFSEESKQKMSNSKKGIIPWNKGLTKEDPRVSSYIRSGDSHHLFGQKVTNRSPLSEDALRNVRDGHKKRYVKIKCNETGKIYESIKEAAQDLNIRGGNISKNVKGQTPTVGGYTFSRVWES